MDLQSHCLFCLEKIVPYKIPSGEDEFDKSLTFQTVCGYLKIRFPNEDERSNKKISDPAVLSMTCEKFLCLGCFEMAEESRRLYGEMEDVQRKMQDVMGRMKEVIVRHDISENLSASDKTLREAFEKKVWNVSKKGQDGVCLGFVEMFQTLVKEADGGKCGDDNASEFSRKQVLSSLSGRKTDTVSEVVHPDKVKVEAEAFVEEEGDMIEDDHFGLDFEDGMDMNDSDVDSCRKESVTDVVKAEDGDDEEWRPDKQRSTSKASKSRQTPVKRKRLSINRATPSRKCKRSRTDEPVIVTTSSKEKPKNEYAEDGPIKCPECDLSFPSTNKLWAHRKKDHPRDMPTLKRLMSIVPVLPIENPTGRLQTFNCLRVCTVCNCHVKEAQATRFTRFMEHMLSHEDDTPPDLLGPHKCTECDMQFRLKMNLDIHKGCIHEARQVEIRCEYCTNYTLFQTREDLIEHLKNEHSKTIYSCKNCLMSYISLERLLIHMNRHCPSKRLHCPLCSTVTATIRKLNRHCAKEHPEVKELFSCDVCGKSEFVSGYDLRRHKSLKHAEASNDTETIVCDICKNGKVYRTKSNLREHIKNQHGDGKRFQCDQCEKRYQAHHLLQEHIEKDHENFRHVCSTCGNKYKGIQQLKYHMKTHTGEGLLACHFCGKMFVSTSRLNIHLKSHTPAQPEEKVVCEECGKEFDNRFRLQSHKRNVHPTKTFDCSVCKLKFKKSDQFRSHMRTHTGERPFTCPVCQMGFNRRDIMRVHVKRVHKMEYSEIEKQLKDEQTN